LSPADFWSMSLLEWNDALMGLAEKNGADFSDGMDGDDLAELMELYPDG
jgi:hypothetical protein